jgi:peptide/nickel transport system substrate-binding protein
MESDRRCRGLRPRETDSPHRGRRAAATLGALLVAAATATACAGGGASVGNAASGSASSSGTLTLAMASAPTTLDPGGFNTATEWFWDLAYESPIVYNTQGQATPGLAVKWSYVGTGNKVFDLTLRPGVKFSDGTPLTAAAVKQSIAYETAFPGGGAAARWKTGKTITVTGPLTLQITSAKPDPDIARELDQDLAGSFIVSPQALEDPSALGTSTDGTGPYILQKKTSVVGNYYTYTANPNYWNKSAQYYKTVVIKVIPTQNSVLDALKTGQIEAAPGDYTTASAAKSAGLQVTDVDSEFLGLVLADRTGTLNKALANVQVRQAINYAIDRQTITKALFGSYAVPTESIVYPSSSSQSGTYYTYNPAKAKQLLAAGGYSHGLTLQTLTTTYNGQNEITQAIAADLAKVGITLDLTTDATQAQYLSDVEAAKYPVFSVGFGVLPLYLEGPQLYLHTSGTWNPFNSDDAALGSLYEQAAATTGTQQDTYNQELVKEMTEQGWFALATLAPRFYFATSAVAGIAPTQAEPQVDAVWIKPAGE